MTSGGRYDGGDRGKERWSVGAKSYNDGGRLVVEDVKINPLVWSGGGDDDKGCHIYSSCHYCCTTCNGGTYVASGAGVDGDYSYYITVLVFQEVIVMMAMSSLIVRVACADFYAILHRIYDAKLLRVTMVILAPVNNFVAVLVFTFI